MCVWCFGWNWFVFRGKEATVSKMYCNMLCSCFISVPAHVHAFLSLPRQIPVVIPSTQCNKPRLGCAVPCRGWSVPQLHPSFLSFSGAVCQLQGAVRSGALQNTMATNRATMSYYHRTKWSKLLENKWALLILKMQKALLLFNILFPPATHQCIFPFLPFH